MGLTLGSALRIFPEAPGLPRASRGIAFVGAGGKTTAIFKIARESAGPAVITSTTHLGDWQAGLADGHLIATSIRDPSALGSQHVTLVTGPIGEDHRTAPVSDAVLHKLQELSALNGWALLIEADGSRQRPLKAPDDAEPCIPPFVELVAVMVGLSGLGKSVSEAHIHRPQRFSELSGLNRGTAVTVEGLAKVLKHSDGGLKNIPLGARRVVVLNQAETRERQSQGRALASMLLPEFDAVVIASLVENAIYAVHEPSAGIVLAAGEARRFGQPKQLLQWEGMPMVRAVTTIALGAGLSPVVVVTGASAEAVGRCVADLPVQVARNEGWADGQASSIRTGLSACPGSIGSAVFLLADQPRITPGLIHGLIDMHAAGLDPIVAPLILEERRGNPVLFDRRTFKDLRELHGDEGGRGIFGNYRVQYLPWHDPTVLLDIDTPEDYSRSMWEAR